MASSAIDKELIRYFTLLDTKQKETLLAMIKSFLKPGSGVATDRTTIEQYNKELDEAIERINRGEYTTFEELEKEIKGW
jgi:tRNA A58 N-methylase Trm61